ncbi:putative transposase [Streptomyces sp. NBRC 110611]|nr:putative transposase [Streptomyces sp. NBRC 110611]
MSDELWSLIESLLPAPGPKLVEGRPRIPDRQALCGILFVLHTGIQWEYLPQELGFGSGVTCWRRLAAWNEAGVWDQLHALLLKRLRSARKLDSSRAVIDASRVRAARRGPKAVPARCRRRRNSGLVMILWPGLCLQGDPLRCWRVWFTEL